MPKDVQLYLKKIKKTCLFPFTALRKTLSQMSACSLQILRSLEMNGFKLEPKMKKKKTWKSASFTLLALSALIPDRFFCLSFSPGDMFSIISVICSTHMVFWIIQSLKTMRLKLPIIGDVVGCKTHIGFSYITSAAPQAVHGLVLITLLVKI